MAFESGAWGSLVWVWGRKSVKAIRRQTDDMMMDIHTLDFGDRWDF